MSRDLLHRVRWGNVALALTVLGALVGVVLWPLVGTPAPALAPDAPRPLVAAGAGDDVQPRSTPAPKTRVKRRDRRVAPAKPRAKRHPQSRKSAGRREARRRRSRAAGSSPRATPRRRESTRAGSPPVRNLPSRRRDGDAPGTTGGYVAPGGGRGRVSGPGGPAPGGRVQPGGGRKRGPGAGSSTPRGTTGGEFGFEGG